MLKNGEEEMLRKMIFLNVEKVYIKKYRKTKLAS